MQVPKATFGPFAGNFGLSQISPAPTAWPMTQPCAVDGDCAHPWISCDPRTGRAFGTSAALPIGRTLPVEVDPREKRTPRKLARA